MFFQNALYQLHDNHIVLLLFYQGITQGNELRPMIFKYRINSPSEIFSPRKLIEDIDLSRFPS